MTTAHTGRKEQTMSRYIDADATRDLLIGSISLTNGIDTALKDAPTIDIVRCKECVWYKDFDGCFFSTDGVEPDDFCSYGEREGE